MFQRPFRWWDRNGQEWFRRKHSTDLFTWQYSTTLKRYSAELKRSRYICPKYKMLCRNMLSFEHGGSRVAQLLPVTSGGMVAVCIANASGKGWVCNLLTMFREVSLYFSSLCLRSCYQVELENCKIQTVFGHWQRKKISSLRDFSIRLRLVLVYLPWKCLHVWDLSSLSPSPCTPDLKFP